MRRAEAPLGERGAEVRDEAGGVDRRLAVADVAVGSDKVRAAAGGAVGAAKAPICVPEDRDQHVGVQSVGRHDHVCAQAAAVRSTGPARTTRTSTLLMACADR
jgi:hypothetical protein